MNPQKVLTMFSKVYSTFHLLSNDPSHFSSPNACYWQSQREFNPPTEFRSATCISVDIFHNTLTFTLILLVVLLSPWKCHVPALFTFLLRPVDGPWSNPLSSTKNHKRISSERHTSDCFRLRTQTQKLCSGGYIILRWTHPLESVCEPPHGNLKM